MSARQAISPKRMVYLDGAFEGGMSKQRKALTELFSDDADKPILLVVSSYGGSVGGLNALMDRIGNLRDSGARIDCLIEGYAMSAGLIVSQACERRYMGRYAKVMAHGVTLFLLGAYDIADLKRKTAEAERDTLAIADLFARRTIKRASYWSDLFQTNEPHYFRADEALALGLVDEVIG